MTTANVAKITSDGGLQVSGTQAAASTASWTSATTVNTALTISVAGYNTVTVAMANTSTMTAGTLTFEVSPDNSNWFAISMARIDSYTVENAYVMNTVAPHAWSTSVDGFTNFRVRLSGTITGTGTATVIVTPQAMPIEPIVTVGQSLAGSLQATATQGNAGATAWLQNVSQINGVTPLMGNGVTGTGSLRVTNATSTTGTITSVTAATASTTILASNANRQGASVFNDSTAILYLSLSATAASTTVYSVQIPAGGYFELPNTRLYTGQLTGIWSAANGAARVTENT